MLLSLRLFSDAHQAKIYSKYYFVCQDDYELYENFLSLIKTQNLKS